MSGPDTPELTEATATAEIAWVAREARALLGSDDERRRSRYMARKAALLAYIAAVDERQAATPGGPSPAVVVGRVGWLGLGEDGTYPPEDTGEFDRAVGTSASGDDR